jgi:hypothetical protein
MNPDWLNPTSVGYWLQTPAVVQGELALAAGVAFCFMGVLIAIYLFGESA